MTERKDNASTFRKTGLSSDHLKAYGLENLSFPQRPITQQLLAMHALFLGTFEQIVPILQAFIEKLDLEKSAAFRMWKANHPNLKTVEQISEQFAMSVAYFLFKGFDENNRLNFEIDLINFLSEFETYHFHKDHVGMTRFLTTVFNAIDHEYVFGDLIAPKKKEKRKGTHDIYRDGLAKHYNSDDIAYKADFKKALDGQHPPRMMMLSADPHHRSMVPHPKNNFHVDEDNIKQFGCAIKKANLDPEKIKFDDQLFINYANHWHDGDETKARDTLNIVLKGDGDLEQTKTFQGYLPLGSLDSVPHAKYNGWEKYVGVLSSMGRDSPLEIHDLHNIYHFYNKEDGELEEVEEDEVPEEEDDGEEVRVAFGSIATPFKPSTIWHGIKGDETKALKRQLQQMAHALEVCNKDRKEWLRRKGELLDTSSFEDTAEEEDGVGKEGDEAGMPAIAMDGIGTLVSPTHFYNTLMGKDKDISKQQFNELLDALDACNRRRGQLIAQLKEDEAAPEEFGALGDLLDARQLYAHITGNKERTGRNERADAILREATNQSDATPLPAAEVEEFNSPLDVLNPLNLPRALFRGDETNNLKTDKYSKLVEESKGKYSNAAPDAASTVQFESPFTMADPLTLYNTIRHGDQSTGDVGYAKLINDANASAAEYDRTMTFNANPFSDTWRTVVGSDKKEMNEKKEAAYAALVRCHDEVGKLQRRLEAKQKVKEDETTAFQSRVSRTHSLKGHDSHHSEEKGISSHGFGDRMHVTPMLFEVSKPLALSSRSVGMVEDFKKSIIHLYETDNMTGVELESMKNDVRTLLLIIKDGGMQVEHEFVVEILVTMYNVKLTMLNIRGVQARIDEKGQLEPMPYQKHVIERKSLLRKKREDRIAAKVMDENYNSLIVAPEEEGELSEEEEELQKEEEEKYLNVVKNPVIETPEEEKAMEQFTRTISMKPIIEKTSMKDMNKKLFFNKDKTLQVRTNFDPFKYVSWIVGLFQGNGNTLVAFTKKLFVSLQTTVNQVLHYASEHKMNIPAIVSKIRGVLSQLDVIVKPVKNYALQAIHYIPQLVKNANLQENLMNVVKFVTSVIGNLMQYSSKVFNFVIENKAIFNNALSWVVKGAKYVGSNASTLTSNGTKLLSQVTPYISSAASSGTKALSSVTPYISQGLGQGMKALGGGSKLLTSAGNQAIKGGVMIMR